ncbi:winged helix-turn-helix transcriptional regulator [Sphingobacterium haloxyli]|uniref:Transcriptional regulator n=1 Tax=Sphingobacterium haloxyli TaxID=2100533 RepID=A0A2S9J4N8_9SPHI|nr:helix-turn-helix domain-containing protein [Sphingobacterium haloxyli]PRD47720.1 transcriptional regulator [Sphingobacterium haloxyli]
MKFKLIDIDLIKKCPETYLLAVNDTLNVLAGKWKLPIMASLQFGKKRFKDLEKEIPKITPRMLSKELRDLEINGMVTRTVYGTYPVAVEYEFTESGKSFKKVIDAMVEWGIEHRNRVLK